MNVLRLAANVADTETVTINGVVFEFDTNSAVTSGRTAVDVTAAQTPAAASTALVAAINASSCGFRAKKISDNEVLIWKLNGGSTAAAVAETLAGANNAWAAATCFGGADTPAEIPTPIIVKRTPTATEVALQTMHFPLRFNPTIVQGFVQTSAGVTRAWDGAITVADNIVTMASSGTTDVSSNDVVVLLAY